MEWLVLTDKDEDGPLMHWLVRGLNGLLILWGCVGVIAMFTLLLLNAGVKDMWTYFHRQTTLLFEDMRDRWLWIDDLIEGTKTILTVLVFLIGFPIAVIEGDISFWRQTPEERALENQRFYRNPPF